MDLRNLGIFDNTILSTLQGMLDISEEVEKQLNTPYRVYVRDAKAMARTPADVKEYPNAYQFIVNMPGTKPSEVKVQLEDDNVSVVTGERRREKEKDEKERAKYLRMERRVGKFMRKFASPENANTKAIKAVCRDGVLTVTVDKLPPPEPKKPKTIQVLKILGAMAKQALLERPLKEKIFQGKVPHLRPSKGPSSAQCS
ncbi:hypothetical protein Ancab_001885 [Ancistrocladus abbreviatus]